MTPLFVSRTFDDDGALLLPQGEGWDEGIQISFILISLTQPSPAGEGFL